MVAAIAFGLVLRVWLLGSRFGVVDSDEAVAGLVARKVLDGEWSPFFWGQAYGGSLEAIPTAVIFAVLGPSTFTLKLVAIALHAVASVLVWRAGRRLVDERAGALAGLLLWTYPLAFVLGSTKGRLFYAAALVLVAAAVLACLRLAAAPSRWDAAGLGLCVGAGVWATPLVVFAVLPVGAWLLFTNRAVLRRAPEVVAGALVGASPWLVHGLRNDWVTLEHPPSSVITTYAERLRLWGAELLPGGMGLRRTYEEGEWLLGPIGPLVYGAALVGLVVLAVRCGRRLAPVLLTLAVFPFLFALSKTSSYVAEPRYAGFVTPALALVAAGAVVRLRRPRAAAIAALATAAVLTLVSTAALGDLADRTTTPDDLDVPPVDALVDRLDAADVTSAYCDYWIAYRLTFETDERIVCSPVDHVRYFPYDAAVHEAGAGTYVLYAGDGEDIDFEAELVERGDAHRREEVGVFAVYTLDLPIGPEWYGEVWRSGPTPVEPP